MNERSRIRRMPIIDELTRDDERMLLLPDRSVRVTGLGPAILDLCEDWTRVGDLTDRLVEAYGSPPDTDPVQLVVEHVLALVEEGVLEAEAFSPPGPRASAT